MAAASSGLKLPLAKWHCSIYYFLHINCSICNIMRVSDQIKSGFSSLTAAQQQIAQYVIENADSVAFMTARQLAAEVKQSDAAVIRFAKALGYDGFINLRDALRDEMLVQQGSSGMQARLLSDADKSSLYEQVYKTSAHLIANTMEMNEAAVFDAVVEKFLKARRIMVTGHGTSYPLAAYLAMHLNLCLDKAEVFDVGHGDLADRFRSVGEGDVFVGIGYVRYLPYTIDILNYARQTGATVIAITDKLTSPLAQLADLSIYVTRSNSAIWWSQAGTLAVADLLTSMCIMQDEHTKTHLRQSDEMLSKLGLWKQSE